MLRFTPHMARETLRPLSPFVGVEVLNTGSSMKAWDFYFSSLSICYFRKISNKQKFRGENPTKPKSLSLFCFHDNPLKNNIKRAV